MIYHSIYPVQFNESFFHHSQPFKYEFLSHLILSLLLIKMIEGTLNHSDDCFRSNRGVSLHCNHMVSPYDFVLYDVQCNLQYNFDT